MKTHALLMALALSGALHPSSGVAQRESPIGLRADPGWVMEPAGYPAEAYRIHSDVLDEERQIFVALPPSHASTSRQYPLILVFDGEWNFGPLVTAAAALADAGHAPEAVIVGIANTDRLRDLSPPGLPVSGNDGSGRADLFVRFLDEELRPALKVAFRAGGPTSLVGHSSGGLFVQFAAATRPESFGSILALDSPMHLGSGRATEPLMQLARTSDIPIKIVSLEAGFGWPPEAWSALLATAPSTWTLVRDTIAGETHQSMVWPASYGGLKTLFANYSSVAQREQPPEERLRSFDARNTGGTESMPPPGILLGQVIEDQIDARRLDAAAATLERLVDAYGEGGRVPSLRNSLEAARLNDLVGPTVEELLAAPRASAEAVQDLLGEWRGYSLTEGTTTQTPLGLSLRLEDGVPVGSFSFERGQSHEVEYLTVDREQFSIGYMNGMRPRGLLMYEGAIDGQIFEGEFVLRGVVFRMPDGGKLPKIRFRLERVGR